MALARRFVLMMERNRQQNKWCFLNNNKRVQHQLIYPVDKVFKWANSQKKKKKIALNSIIMQNINLHMNIKE